MASSRSIDNDDLIDDSKPDDGVYCDLAIEHQVLRYLATREPYLAQQLNPFTFYGKYERFLFDQMRKIQAVLPVETLEKLILQEADDESFEAVRDTLAEVMEADALDSHGSFQAATAYIRGLATRRVIQDAAQAAEAHNRRGEITEALTALREAVSFQTRQTIDRGDYLEDFESRVADQKQRAESAAQSPSIIPTGIVPFDQKSGGLLLGEVGVLVAESGAGKSVGKLNFGIAAWYAGFNVIHVGLEMTKKENQFRADAALASIEALSFRLARLTDQHMEKWTRMIERYRAERKNYFEFVSGRGMTMQDIIATVEGIENDRKEKVHLVIVDHIKLVKPQNEKMRDHEAVGASFMEFSVWCQNRQVAGWSSTQSTDEGINRKDGMRITDIKYSRFVAETAQVIMTMFQRDVDKVSNDMQLKVIKGRGIKKGETFVLKPDFDRMVLDKQSFITLGIKTHAPGLAQMGD